MGEKFTASQTGSPDYGSWVPDRFIYLPILLGLAFLVASIPFWFLGAAAILFFAVALYFAYARSVLSPEGRNVQNQILDLAVSNLDWHGYGKALDIGCGSGALTVKVAKKFPQATVTGIDFWGGKWEYSKEICEDNAKAEGVEDRVAFQKASASKLPFDDNTFDAAVSNLCFHEVTDAKDKREVIREALRVVRKGGKFAFQDVFMLKQMYGSPQELVTAVKSWGVSRVEFVETHNASFIPGFLKLPFMVGKIGVIKGEK